MAETMPQYVDRLMGYVGTDDPLPILRQTAPRIAALITARSDDDLRWTTAPDRWSACAILAHLADSEIVASYRIRMILASPGVRLQAFDQNEWASALGYAQSDAFESLALFRALRGSWLGLLDVIDPSWLDRYGVHEERGNESVRHLLRLYAGHDLNHVWQIERLLDAVDSARGTPPPAFEPKPVKPPIANDRRQQLDVRVGTIRSVHDVPAADRLVKLIVDFGDRDRVVIAGIKQERQSPARLAGRQALFVVNVVPRTLCGETSEAMLFDIGHDDGLRPALAEPERPVPNGVRAG
jgi:methionine--tRNA ligase beta chain